MYIWFGAILCAYCGLLLRVPRSPVGFLHLCALPAIHDTCGWRLSNLRSIELYAQSLRRAALKQRFLPGGYEYTGVWSPR